MAKSLPMDPLAAFHIPESALRWDRYTERRKEGSETASKKLSPQRRVFFHIGYVCLLYGAWIFFSFRVEEETYCRWTLEQNLQTFSSDCVCFFGLNTEAAPEQLPQPVATSGILSVITISLAMPGETHPSPSLPCALLAAMTKRYAI